MLTLRASWSALRDRVAQNDLRLADDLLAELDLEAARDAVAFLTRAFVIAAEQSSTLDVDHLLELLGLSVAKAAVGR